MNQKYFKYDRRGKKKIRVKDILMLLSIFSLCVITVIVTGTSVNKNKMKAQSKNDHKIEQSVVSNSEDDYVVSSKIIDSISNETVNNYAEQEYVYSFVKPVEGEIIKPFSPDNLLYSETMDDWRTHMGIDISCAAGTSVVASEKGLVKKVYYDINYGNVVSVESGEYEVLYTSLSSDVLVTVGQNIVKGDVIGTSSDSCISEICDEPHIHFEIKKNGIYINPADVINFNSN